MSKYLVETFYTCTFKITHKLDELNEKKLSELENRKDGEVQIIDVRLNNRKTKTTNKKGKIENTKTNLNVNDSSNFSSIINEKIITEDNHKNFPEKNNPKTIIQKFNKKNKDR